MQDTTSPKDAARDAGQINLSASKYEYNLITKIAQRTVALAVKFEIDYDFVTADMDITACHANGNPLRLAELLEADDANFAHDVFGIARHINRATGKLENFFLPRYSI